MTKEYSTHHGNITFNDSASKLFDPLNTKFPLYQKNAAYKRSQLYESAYALNGLLAAAMPIISIVNRIDQTTASSTCAQRFDQHLLYEVEAFESQAQKRGYQNHTIAAAQHCLCAFIDDLIFTSHLAAHYNEELSYLNRFHPGSSGQDHMALVLDRCQQQPEQFIETMELIYTLFILGYEGPFRQSSEAYKRRLHIIEHLHRQILLIRGDNGHQLITHLTPASQYHQTDAASKRLWLWPLMGLLGLTAIGTLSYGLLI